MAAPIPVCGNPALHLTQPLAPADQASEPLALTPVQLSPSPDSARRLVEAFLSARKATTLAAYQQDLESFRAFAAATDVDEAARLLLSRGHGEANAMGLAFKAKLLEEKLAPATINRRLSALRSLVHVARVLGMVPWQLEVENVASQPYRDTRGPGRDGVQALLDELAKRSDAKGARDTAIVRLAYDLALRRAEITALDLTDVDMKAGMVAVMGKGKSEKISLSLPDETMDVLAAWIEARGEAAGALFTNVDHRPEHRGKRIAGNSVRRIIARLGDVVGVRARPHGLRHAGITEGLDQTRGDLRAVMRFARHSKPETTKVYDDNRQDLGGEVAKKVAAGVGRRRISGDDAATGGSVRA